MEILVYFFHIVIAIALLWKCADWFVEAAAAIAERAGVPHMFIGLVLVSLATTAPELTTSLLAALRGNPEMALGNAIGSVIVDDTVALGIGAILAPTPLLAHPRLLKTSGAFLLLACAALILMAWDGRLSQVEGLVLVCVFVFYIYWSLRDAKHRESDTSAGSDSKAGDDFPGLRKCIMLFGGGAVGVLLGSHLLLKGALGLGGLLGVPEYAMGLTVVAVGTSIPEIATVAVSALKNKGGIGIGNIIGADILNICWVAGLSASVNPLQADPRFVAISLVCMAVIVCVMLVMVRTGHMLVRWEGATLLFLYVVYVQIVLFFVPRAAII